jgi:hypothetical protein
MLTRAHSIASHDHVLVGRRDTAVTRIPAKHGRVTV